MLTLNRWEPTCRDGKAQSHGQALVQPGVLITGLSTELSRRHGHGRWQALVGFENCPEKGDEESLPPLLLMPSTRLLVGLRQSLLLETKRIINPSAYKLSLTPNSNGLWLCSMHFTEN